MGRSPIDRHQNYRGHQNQAKSAKLSLEEFKETWQINVMQYPGGNSGTEEKTLGRHYWMLYKWFS